MKKFTTSAQKTLLLPKEIIVRKLQDEMTKDTALIFEDTEKENIKEAKLKDGSKIIIAAFDKGNGKTLAMIENKNLPENKVRSEVQSTLKHLPKFLNEC